jgi:hypothetical protein
MGFPIEIVNATFLFIFFAFLASLVNLWLKRTKKLSKDNAQCVSGPSPLVQAGAPRIAPTRARTRIPPSHRPLHLSTFSVTLRLACLSIIVATFCLWLMWLCTWLHQWHPLISPTLPSAGRSPAPAEGGSAGGGHR